jgi:enoyl-[acyl-carrier-protein] reductase (NADH)
MMTKKYTIRIQTLAKKQGLTFNQMMDKQVNKIPLRKYATTQDVAESIEGLLSDFFNHITSMNTMCDGGFTRSY